MELTKLDDEKAHVLLWRWVARDEQFCSEHDARQALVQRTSVAYQEALMTLAGPLGADGLPLALRHIAGVLLSMEPDKTTMVSEPTVLALEQRFKANPACLPWVAGADQAQAHTVPDDALDEWLARFGLQELRPRLLHELQVSRLEHLHHVTPAAWAHLKVGGTLARQLRRARTALPDFERVRSPLHTMHGVWLNSFKELAGSVPAALDLLKLCAVLLPDAIDGSSVPALAASLGRGALFEHLHQHRAPLEAVQALLQHLEDYSLVTRGRRRLEFSVHRVTQHMLRREYAGEVAERALAVGRVLGAQLPPLRFVKGFGPSAAGVGGPAPAGRPNYLEHYVRVYNVSQCLFELGVGMDAAARTAAGRIQLFCGCYQTFVSPADLSIQAVDAIVDQGLQLLEQAADVPADELAVAYIHASLVAWLHGDLARSLHWAERAADRVRSAPTMFFKV